MNTTKLSPATEAKLLDAICAAKLELRDNTLSHAIATLRLICDVEQAITDHWMEDNPQEAIPPLPEGYRYVGVIANPAAPPQDLCSHEGGENGGHQFDPNDELAYCPICGGAEGSLPDECPKERMTPAQDDAVYRGLLNYRDGKWIELFPKQQPKPPLDEETQAWVDAKAAQLQIAIDNREDIELPKEHPCHEAIKWSKGRSGTWCHTCGWFH